MSAPVSFLIRREMHDEVVQENDGKHCREVARATFYVLMGDGTIWRYIKRPTKAGEALEEWRRITPDLPDGYHLHRTKAL